MLKLIIEMLQLQKIGDSEYIDIAKGKNKLPETFKELKQAVKWQLQKR
jgi:hypothetical protein